MFENRVQVDESCVAETFGHKLEAGEGCGFKALGNYIRVGSMGPGEE
jgi:hypothetical protein